MAITIACLCGAARAQDVRAFDLTLTDRRVALADRTVRVTEGDTVELRIASDESGELHLHGYDVTIRLEAGETTVTRVEARVAGRFPITAHGFEGSEDNEHAHKALLYLEVYPR